MITVAILINGNPILAKAAVNEGYKNERGETAYKTDSGEIVFHYRSEGAVALAQKLLETIRIDDKLR